MNFLFGTEIKLFYGACHLIDCPRSTTGNALTYGQHGHKYLSQQKLSLVLTLPPPPRPLCTLHLRILVCSSFSFTFALNIFHNGQESLLSKYWIEIRWLLSLRVNSQNTPYIGLCDCSQQTELRQRDTPRLFQSMLLKQHSPIKHKQLVGQVVPTALKHKKL